MYQEKSESSQLKTSVRTMISVLVLLLTFMAAQTPQVVLAQASSESDGAPSSGPRKHLATIIFAGLGGAIVGLSTLSFYGRPQDKLGNIGIGFAVGIIAGTGYVTYKLATKPHEFYGDRPWIENEINQTRYVFNGRTALHSDFRPAQWTFEF
jgi:hypothetical protein